MSTSQSPRIAIIGGGPAGLTLARLLHVSKANVNVVIYERDTSASSRPHQGGTLDLHEGTGLTAVRKCNLWEAFKQYARYDGQELVMLDKNATVYVHLGKGKTEGDRPEIDRKDLKKILTEGLPKDSIRWGKRLEEVLSDGRLRFENQDALEGPYDLVVGAEGGRSRVRELLSHIEPDYVGISGYELQIDDPASTCPALNKRVGRGAYFTSSDEKFLNAQRLSNGSLKVRTWFRCSESEVEGTLEELGKIEVVDALKERYQEWAPELLELLHHADPESLRPWILYELPIGFKWKHKQGFTLIGDASSLSAPFSGEGVNKAMTDAMELAEWIEKSQTFGGGFPLDQAIRSYEEQMFPRSRSFQKRTADNMDAMFQADAPVGTIARMIVTMTQDSSSFGMAILGTRPVISLIYALFWIWMQIGWLLRTYWRKT